MLDRNNKPLKPNDDIYIVGMNGKSEARVVEGIAGGFIRVKYGEHVVITHHKDRIEKR